MSRADAVARVIELQQGFRRQIADVPSSSRIAIAHAVRELGRAYHRVDVSAALTLDELADLLEEAPRPPPSRREPPIDRYAMPPDMEGDEFLLDRMRRCGGPRR